MSASKQLRELMTEEVTESFDAIFWLHHALPEIVEAIVALEHIQEPLLDRAPLTDYERFVYRRCSAALTALEEKLKT